MALTDLLGKNWKITKEIAKAKISNFFKGNVPKYASIALPLTVLELFNVAPIYAQDNQELDKILSEYTSAYIVGDFDTLRDKTKNLNHFIVSKDTTSFEKRKIIDKIECLLNPKKPQELTLFGIETLKKIGSIKKIHPQVLVKIAEVMNLSLKFYGSLEEPRQETYSALENAFMDLVPTMMQSIGELENWNEKEEIISDGEHTRVKYSPTAIEMIHNILYYSVERTYQKFNPNKINEENSRKLKEIMEEKNFIIKKGLSNTQNCSIGNKCILLNDFIYYIEATGANEFLIEYSPYIPRMIMSESSSEEERNKHFGNLIDNLTRYHRNYKGPLVVLRKIADELYYPSRKEGEKIPYTSRATMNLCRLLGDNIIPNKINNFPFDYTLKLIEEISYSKENTQIILEQMDIILERFTQKNERHNKIKSYVKNIALGEQYGEDIKNLASEIYEKNTGLILE